MISEVDIRDWEHIDIPASRKALSLQKAYMGNNAELQRSIEILYQFLSQIEELRKKQLRELKIPSLFRKGEE